MASGLVSRLQARGQMIVRLVRMPQAHSRELKGPNSSQQASLRACRELIAKRGTSSRAHGQAFILRLVVHLHASRRQRIVLKRKVVGEDKGWFLTVKKM